MKVGCNCFTAVIVKTLLGVELRIDSTVDGGGSSLHWSPGHSYHVVRKEGEGGWEEITH